jgi:hypothetical protein
MMAEQKKLFDEDTGERNPFSNAKFGGSGYIKKYDHKRLTGKMLKIFNFLKDLPPESWVTNNTLAQISGAADGGSASSLARKLRSPLHGEHDLQKKRVGDPKHGFYVYRLEVNPNWKGHPQIVKGSKKKAP